MGCKERGLMAAKGANGAMSLMVAGIFALFAARRGNDQDDDPTFASLGYGLSSFVPNFFLNYASLDKLGRVLFSDTQSGCIGAVWCVAALLWALMTAPIGCNLGYEATNEFKWLEGFKWPVALLGAVNMVATRFVGAHALITSMRDAYRGEYPGAFRLAVQRGRFGSVNKDRDSSKAAQTVAGNVSTACLSMGWLFSVLCRQMAAPMLPLFVSMAENGFKKSFGDPGTAAAMAWPAGLVTQVFYMHSAKHLYANMAPYLKRISKLCSKDKCQAALGWFLGFAAVSVMSYFSGAGFSEDAKERVMPKNSTVEEAFGVAGPMVSYFPSFLIEIYPVIAMIAAGMFANGGASFHFVIDGLSPVPDDIRKITQPTTQGDSKLTQQGYGAIGDGSGAAATPLEEHYQRFNVATHKASCLGRVSRWWRDCSRQESGRTPDGNDSEMAATRQSRNDV